MSTATKSPTTRRPARTSSSRPRPALRQVVPAQPTIDPATGVAVTHLVAELGPDALTAAGGGSWPPVRLELSADAQRELVKVAQTAATGSQRQAKAVELLLAANIALVFRHVHDAVAARPAAAARIREELEGEAALLVVEAARDYLPERGAQTFTGFLSTRLRLKLVDACGTHDGPAGLPASWRVVGAVAANVLRDRDGQTQQPSMAQLRAETQQRLLAHEMARLSDSAIGHVFTDDAGSLEEHALTKLRRSGFLAAVAALPQVLAATSATLSLDVAVGDAESPSMLALLEDVPAAPAPSPGSGPLLEVALGGFDAELRELVAAHLLEGASAAGEVKSAVHMAAARLRAPHARAAYLRTPVILDAA